MRGLNALQLIFQSTSVTQEGRKVETDTTQRDGQLSPGRSGCDNTDSDVINRLCTDDDIVRFGAQEEHAFAAGNHISRIATLDTTKVTLSTAPFLAAKHVHSK